MKVKQAIRIPIGFIAGFVFLLRAEPTPVSFVSGLIIMVLGEAVRFISAGTLIKYEGVTRNGIYNFTRNPLYVGSFLIGVGACIISRDPVFSLFFFIAYPLIYFQVIKREEVFLKGRYGDEYTQYLNEVPRFWSGRLDLKEIVKESSPFLAVKNGELYTISGIFAVTVIMVVKMVW